MDYYSLMLAKKYSNPIGLKIACFLFAILGGAVFANITITYEGVFWYFLWLPLSALAYAIASFSFEKSHFIFFMSSGLALYAIGLAVMFFDYVGSPEKIDRIFAVLLLVSALMHLMPALFKMTKEQNVAVKVIEGILIVIMSLMMLRLWFISALLITAYLAKQMFGSVFTSFFKATVLLAEAGIGDGFFNNDEQNQQIFYPDNEKSSGMLPRNINSESPSLEVSERLQGLQKLLAQELISEEEYEDLRRRILESI